jgi:16S rRNA (uracil1498-N3)-methyltransferase
MSLLDPKAEQRRILFADEAGDAMPVAEALTDKPARVALLTGPEGGFTPAEREKLRASPLVRPVNLGPRILRADTATFVGLALIQSAWGDWT